MQCALKESHGNRNLDTRSRSMDWPERWQSCKGATRGHLYSRPRRSLGTLRRRRQRRWSVSGPAVASHAGTVVACTQGGAIWKFDGPSNKQLLILGNLLPWMLPPHEGRLLLESLQSISRGLKPSPFAAAPWTAALHLATSTGGSWMAESPGAAKLLTCLRLPYLPVSSLE